MARGIIIRALSGFYYVDGGTAGEPAVACRGRGKLRREKISPLVGDLVRFTRLEDGTGVVDEVLPRRNWFTRPAVANLDRLVILASEALPVTDPQLLDRMLLMAEMRRCQSLVVITKTDLAPGDTLAQRCRKTGYPTVQVSTVTGAGLEELREQLSGLTCAFTGNTGVGKSSLINALDPSFSLKEGEVSERLGRGRHTTRHVELFRLACGARIMDTPGFAAFDIEPKALPRPQELAGFFPDFAPYLGRCEFPDCSHRRERGCAVRAAVERGDISPGRHRSYCAFYEQAGEFADWQRKKAETDS